MLLGMSLFAAVDVQAKYLTHSMHPIQVTFFRQLGLLVGVMFLLTTQGTSILKTHNLKLQITRGVLAAASATLFIFAIAYVPLADAVAVSFAAPFMVTILGAWILKEKVGIRRWAAVSVGFLGMLIVVRPGMGVVHPAAMLILVAASCFALRQIVSRFISGTDRIRTTVCYTAIVATAILVVPVLLVWEMPQTNLEIGLMISMALMAGIAETLVIKALEIAESVALAPVHYSLLIWGVMYGYLVFGQLPDQWTWIGALIIVATGLYSIHREWVLSKANRQRSQ
ncbi:MAG: DMT family transporter [Salaquimonas sp.]